MPQLRLRMEITSLADVPALLTSRDFRRRTTCCSSACFFLFCFREFVAKLFALVLHSVFQVRRVEW